MSNNKQDNKGCLYGIGIFFLILSMIFIWGASEKLNIVYLLLSMVFGLVGGVLIAKNKD